ncbi:hypothetical protein D3C75_946590 [compost metagenome]
MAKRTSPIKTQHMPPIWKFGIGERLTPPSTQSSQSAETRSAWRAMENAWWEINTPLGFPVVPLVYICTTICSGLRGHGCTGAVWHNKVRSPVGLWSSTSRNAGGALSPATAARASSTMPLSHSSKRDRESSS